MQTNKWSWTKEVNTTITFAIWTIITIMSDQWIFGKTVAQIYHFPLSSPIYLVTRNARYSMTSGHVKRWMICPTWPKKKKEKKLFQFAQKPISFLCVCVCCAPKFQWTVLKVCFSLSRYVCDSVPDSSHASGISVHCCSKNFFFFFFWY